MLYGGSQGADSSMMGAEPLVNGSWWRLPFLVRGCGLLTRTYLSINVNAAAGDVVVYSSEQQN
jgi:hypothetical protein